MTTQPIVHTYELGKFYPGISDYSYANWEDAKIKEFKQHFNVLKIDRVQTDTGSVLVLVDAYPKGK